MAIVTVDVNHYLTKPSVDPVSINSRALSSIHQKVMEKFPRDGAIKKELKKSSYQTIQSGASSPKVNKKSPRNEILEKSSANIPLPSASPEKKQLKNSDLSRNAKYSSAVKSKLQNGYQDNNGQTEKHLQVEKEKLSTRENLDEPSSVSNSLGIKKSKNGEAGKF